MKLTTLSLIFLLSFQAFSSETVLLTCRPPKERLGAPLYRVLNSHALSGVERLILQKTNYTTNPPSVTEVFVPEIVKSDRSFILTVDLAKSGYAHVYASGKVSIIDIQFYTSGMNSMNTSGVVTDYVCE